MKKLREELGYNSQKSFADVFGVAQSTVGGWESGKREPNFETAIRIAKFFNTSLDYLLGVSDSPKPPSQDRSNPDFSEDEITIIYAYRKADTRSRQMVNLTLEPFIPPAQSSVAM